MELLFVVLIGVLVGLAARVTLPRHDLSGVLLLPAVGGAAAAVVWVALTWARLRWDGGWIWVAAIAAALAAVVLTGLVLGRSRSRADDALFERIARGGPPAARAVGATGRAQAASSSRTRGTTTEP